MSHSLRIRRESEWYEIRIEAYIRWWCDDLCDCWQPVIEEISPNIEAGYPRVYTKRLWEGTFISQPTSEEMKMLEDELKEEKERRGIQ